MEIDLDKIFHNTQVLVDRLSRIGIGVIGVTKSFLGKPQIAEMMVRAGVIGLGDSRIENIETMRSAGMTGSMTLLRSPMLSQVPRVVASADVSFNTEMTIIRALSVAAQTINCTHGIVLMLESGDLREGIMSCDLEATVAEVLRLPHLKLLGIGTNLACSNGVMPDDENMGELSRCVETLEAKFGLPMARVSGGNSASLDWAFHTMARWHINELRLGESLLLGCEPLQRTPIAGLYTDAITLVAEVIESKVKPSLPWGTLGQSAFGEVGPVKDCGDRVQSILALGHQDTDPWGLTAPAGLEIIGASSDHLIVDSGSCSNLVGQELTFQLNYSALLRAMTSPFVKKVMNENVNQGLGKDKYSACDPAR